MEIDLKQVCEKKEKNPQKLTATNVARHISLCCKMKSK